jgi:hypothetical protein
MIDSKKIANNILEFLIDPTRIPVEDRVYFRPEENLKNDSYEKAKQDSCQAYKDQSHNSDFYPQKNRSLTREANIMDRKSLIASRMFCPKILEMRRPLCRDLQIWQLLYPGWMMMHCGSPRRCSESG